jgi:hypothetical protein
VKKRLLYLSLALLILPLFLAGCNAGDNAAPMMAPRPPSEVYRSVADSMPMEMERSELAAGIFTTSQAAGTSSGGWTPPAATPPPGAPGDTPGSAPVDALRKIIYNYDYQLETKDMAATLQAIEHAVAAAGGFVSFSNQGGRDDEGQFQFAHMTLRIPTRAAAFFEFSVENAAHVRSKNSSGRDVTDEYFDIEARLRTLATQETRLLELLRQSGDLSDLLQIERELTRVRTDIERLAGSLRRMDDLIDLATFTLNIYAVGEFTPPATTSFGARLGQTVNSSLRGFLLFLQNSLIVLVTLLPFLLLFGAIAYVIIVVCRKRAKKQRLQWEAARKCGNCRHILGENPDQFCPKCGNDTATHT